MATAVAQKGQMNDILRRHEPDIYALLRIVTGFLFLWHGTEKIFGFPEAPPAGAPAFILWVAGPIELVRIPGDDRAPHAPGGIPRERPHGVRLLAGPRDSRSCRSSTRESWRCSTASSFSSSPRAARGGGAWTAAGPEPRDQSSGSRQRLPVSI